jgi:hypothetical protein
MPHWSTRLAVASFSLIAVLAAVGAWLAHGAAAGDQATKGHGSDAARVKAPIAELMHCPLAFAGVHLLKSDPTQSRVAYHFCKPVNADLNQCVLYDGTGPDARLIGIEYLVSDAVYQSMPEEEKAYWHDHKFEVDEGLLKSLTQSGTEERETLAQVRTMWGKVYHTWADGEAYPRGPARLFWSVTGEKPFVLPRQAKLPRELRRDEP